MIPFNLRFKGDLVKNQLYLTPLLLSLPLPQTPTTQQGEMSLSDDYVNSTVTREHYYRVGLQLMHFQTKASLNSEL